MTVQQLLDELEAAAGARETWDDIDCVRAPQREVLDRFAAAEARAIAAERERDQAMVMADEYCEERLNARPMVRR